MGTLDLCKVEIVSETETGIIGAIHNVELSILVDIIWQGINHLKREIEAAPTKRQQYLQHRIDYCMTVHGTILKESNRVLQQNRMV